MELTINNVTLYKKGRDPEEYTKRIFDYYAQFVEHFEMLPFKVKIILPQARINDRFARARLWLTYEESRLVGSAATKMKQARIHEIKHNAYSILAPIDPTNDINNFDKLIQLIPYEEIKYAVIVINANNEYYYNTHRRPYVRTNTANYELKTSNTLCCNGILIGSYLDIKLQFE